MMTDETTRTFAINHNGSLAELARRAVDGVLRRFEAGDPGEQFVVCGINVDQVEGDEWAVVVRYKRAEESLTPPSPPKV
jgi:hypothetical protein